MTTTTTAIIVRGIDIKVGDILHDHNDATVVTDVRLEGVVCATTVRHANGATTPAFFGRDARLEVTRPNNTSVRCRPCPVCGAAETLTVDAASLERWNSGELIQTAFPTMSLNDRELLISGTHSACWEALFADE